MNPLNRREFLKVAAAGATATLAPDLLKAQPAAVATPAPAAPAERRPTPIAMPISVAPLAGQSLERILDDMQERAGVNILMPFIYTHEEHRAGLPASGFRGGNYAVPHMPFYQASGLSFADMRAPEFGTVDVLARTLTATRKRGIKTFAWLIQDNHCPAIEGWRSMYEVDARGKRVEKHPGGPCSNHPRYRALQMGLLQDYIKSYQVDGIMWGSERQGGLLNALSLTQSGPQPPGEGSTCFCEYCQAKARAAGIDVDRARRGFGEIETFVRASRAAPPLRDGRFASFWRVLLNYPELLAWESLWVRSRHELYADLYKTVKAIDPEIPIGWHIWHNVSFSPFQRAEEDFTQIGSFSDFVRPALYNNCAGERFHTFVRGARSAVFGDLGEEETLAMLYSELGYHEAPYGKVSAAGFSADYVERETRRTVAGFAGSATQVWPGIDIDVPVPTGASACTSEGVARAVKASFAGGAKGIILSRNYVEMKPDHLSAAGGALRDLGLI